MKKSDGRSAQRRAGNRCLRPIDLPKSTYYYRQKRSDEPSEEEQKLIIETKSLNMSVFSERLIILLTCVTAALLWGGCSSEDTSSNGASTENARPIRENKSPRHTLDKRERSFLIRGVKAIKQGSYRRALALADSAEKYEPEAAVISFFRGSVYTAMNRLDAAREAYRKALELNPRYPEARLRIGNNELQRGNLRKALQFFKAEEEISSSSNLYEQMGRVYADLGRADSARAAYEKAIALDSTNASAHMKFGQLVQKMGNIEDALVHSRRALALQPKNSNYQFAVGSQLFQLGRLEEAVGYLKSAADARLLHYPAQYNLGQVLMRLGREDKADFYLARADSARRLMDQINRVRNAISRNPSDVEGWVRLGTLYRKAGESSQALKAFRRAASIEPENLAVQNTIAKIMLSSGNAERAIQYLRSILSIDQTRVEAWLNLGVAHAATGNCEEARRSWETALKYRPDDTTATKYLSRSCESNSQ